MYSAVCTPEWRATARVAPGSWVYRDDDPLRGDVALLVLDEQAPCDAHATLWLAPISGGLVRAHGFPRAEPYGIPADAELGGDGGRLGEFRLLNPVRVHQQWIESGFSGAGVLKLDGDHAGHVIGIVVADYRNADAKAAWMMPTETILRYLRDIAHDVAGEPADRLGGPGDGLPELAHGDTLRVALTRELTRLLTGGWSGTVVLPGGGGTGTAWLVRLVRTADRRPGPGPPAPSSTRRPGTRCWGSGPSTPRMTPAAGRSPRSRGTLWNDSGCLPGIRIRSASCCGEGRRPASSSTARTGRRIPARCCVR